MLLWIGRLAMVLFFLVTTRYEAMADYILLRQKSSGKSIKKKIKLRFLKGPDGARILYATTYLPVKKGEVPNEVIGEDVYFSKKRKRKPGKLFLGFGRLKSSFEIQWPSGQIESYSYSLRLKKNRFVVKKCKQQSLQRTKRLLKIKKKKIFAGFVCSKVDGKNRVHVSVPGEFELSSTNIFEVAGKGERWKSFLISDIETAKGKDLDLKYTWGQTTIDLGMKSTSTNSKIENERTASKFQLHLGLGGGTVGYKTPISENSGFAPMLFAQALTAPYLWILTGRMEVHFAMPASGIQYYSVNFGTGPQFSFGQSSLQLLFEYLSLGESESETVTSFSHNQMGAGLDLRLALSNSSQFIIYGNYNGLGGASTHIGAKIGMLWGEPGTTYWGVALNYGMQSVVSEVTQNQSDFNQLFVVLTYGF